MSPGAVPCTRQSNPCAGQVGNPPGEAGRRETGPPAQSARPSKLRQPPLQSPLRLPPYPLGCPSRQEQEGRGKAEEGSAEVGAERDPQCRLRRCIAQGWKVGTLVTAVADFRQLGTTEEGLGSAAVSMLGALTPHLLPPSLFWRSSLPMSRYTLVLFTRSLFFLKLPTPSLGLGRAPSSIPRDRAEFGGLPDSRISPVAHLFQQWP